VLSPRTVRVLLVVLSFSGALALRIAFSYDTVFRDGEVAFQDPDGSFHVRTVENLVAHFPLRSGVDPYSGFPRGQSIDTGPFHDYAIGTLAWMAGLGSPSRYLTDLIAAWFPAVLGALIVVPVYFLGRKLFNPVAAFIAAGLLGILPGTFLWVTRLGNPDHHVTEVLLSTLLLLLLVTSLQGSFSWKPILLAGLALGCYLSTRATGSFLVVFLEIWAIGQICVNHMRGQNSRRIWQVTVPPLAIGWAIFFVAGSKLWSDIATLVLLGGMVVISTAVALAERIPSRPAFFLTLLGAAVAGGGVLVLLKPQLVQAAIAMVADRSRGPAQTVGELRPLLGAMGDFSWAPAWAEFTTCWFVAPLALGYTGWRALKENSSAHLLFTVWTALMMLASFQHIRNCYYLAVNMAVLTGFACEYLMRQERRYERIGAGLLLSAALIVPNVSLAYAMVRTDTGPSADWRGALAFLRNETPEPFGDPAAFDRYYPRLADGAAFPYPPSAYGILSWWDFGHWITALGRRIPVANGMQTGAEEAARFFTSTDPTEAAAILRETGARYVIADASMPVGLPQLQKPGEGNFAAMTTWASVKGNPVRGDRYWETFTGTDGVGFPVFYPAYYESMMARLYLFDGEPQTPAGSTWVIQYSNETERGQTRKRMKWNQRFESYEEAERYVREHPGLKLVIGGMNPLRSCVPLAKLAHYRMAYASRPHATPGDAPLRAVKIFEFLP
jgi:oligosaccharyl transferase (archaeosortase A-associated)